MLNFKKALSLLSFSLLMLSCSSKNEGSFFPSNSTNKIIDGTLVQGQLNTGKYVVGMFAPRFGNCSGVIIAEDIILTAAHCIPSNPRSLTLIFDTQLNNASQSNMRSVITAQVTPYWLNQNSRAKNKGDLALIKFQGPLPNGYKPAFLLTSGAYISDNSFTLIAGYGLGSRSSSIHHAGILRETFTTITQARYSQTEVMISQIGGRGTCSGDSGGPAFLLINGNYYLWGITSQGDSECRNYGIYTSIVPYLPWIKQTMSRLRLQVF